MGTTDTDATKKNAEETAYSIYAPVFTAGVDNMSILALDQLFFQKTIRPPQKLNSLQQFLWDTEFQKSCGYYAANIAKNAISNAMSNAKKDYKRISERMSDRENLNWELAFFALSKHCRYINHAKGRYSKRVSDNYPSGVSIGGDAVIARVPLPEVDSDNEFYLQPIRHITVTRKLPKWVKRAFEGMDHVPPRIVF